jgi:hypothetical protein
MSIVEEIRNRPAVGYALAGVMAIASGATLWAALGSSTPSGPTMGSKLYFSDDDGKTFFTDDSARIPPYDHNGKRAYQAAVFKCGAKAPFVGYLITYPDAAKAQLEAISANERRSASPKLLGIKKDSGLVKRPGDKDWLPLSGDQPKGDILNPRCPDGSSDSAAEVVP